LPETSSRATAALDALSSAKAKYNESTGEGEEIAKEAQAYYDL
jgi:hypothetical protein